jgi:hypothetical protein
MKVIAYTALRYGRDYYDAAIRSVIDAVDEYHVLYAVSPSHGHWSDVPCPETEDELRAIAEHRAGSKLRWHRGEWAYEGQQRDSIHQYAPDADVIIVLDSDEVWGDYNGISVVQHAIAVALGFDCQQFRMPMIHLWKAFDRAILNDPAYPVRVIRPKISGGEMTIPRLGHSDRSVIYHFGYAQRPEIVEYKWKIHGHLGELRRDTDWFHNIYMDKDRRFDLHPVGSEYWNWEHIEPLTYMPSFMAEHPYYGMDVIE